MIECAKRLEWAESAALYYLLAIFHILAPAIAKSCYLRAKRNYFTG